MLPPDARRTRRARRSHAASPMVRYARFASSDERTERLRVRDGAPGASDDRGKHRGRHSGARSAHVGLFLHGRSHRSGHRESGARGPRVAKASFARRRARGSYSRRWPDRSRSGTRRRWRSIHSRSDRAEGWPDLERPVRRDARPRQGDPIGGERGWRWDAPLQAPSLDRKNRHDAVAHLRRLPWMSVDRHRRCRATRRRGATRPGQGGTGISGGYERL